MLNSEINAQSKHFPTGFRRDFDAHVYYTSQTRDDALRLRDRALADFDGLPVFVGAMIDRLVGPHPIPMFEMCFPNDLFGQAVLWLLHQRRNLTVLVHEVTGDDLRDHSVGAFWLGDRLALDESKLDPSPVNSSSLQL